MRSIAGQEREIAGYPIVERGFFHLTPEGWIRQDRQPFPEGRMETWAYELECLADDAKEQVCLTRTWTCPAISEQGRAAFKVLHGQPIQPQPMRNVTFQCEV